MTPKSRAVLLVSVQCLYLAGCGQSGSKSNVEQLQKQVDSLQSAVQLIQQNQTNEMAAWRKSFTDLRDVDGKIFKETSALDSNEQERTEIGFILLSNRVTLVEDKAEMLRHAALYANDIAKSNLNANGATVQAILTNISEIYRQLDTLESNRSAH